MISDEQKIKQIEDQLTILEITVKRLSEETAKDRCVLECLQYFLNLNKKP